MELAPRAAKDLERLEPRTRHRIVEGIKRYALSGHGDVEKLRGEDDKWRLRVGDWRVIFEFDRSRHVIAVDEIPPRDKAYRVRETGEVDAAEDEDLSLEGREARAG